MTTLDELWKLQEAFTEQYFRQHKSLSIKEIRQDKRLFIKQIKEYILNLFSEVGSILDEVPYKEYRSNQNKLGPNLLEEIIDVQKFLWGLCVLCGIDIDEFKECFEAKSQVVKWRYEQEFELEKLRLTENRPIAVVDIDGVLAPYPEPLLRYLEEQTGNKYRSLEEAKSAISPAEYATYKEQYRLSGIKACLPLADGAVELTQTLHNNGWVVVIVSGRPYLQYLRILPDTLTWLKRNGIYFDLLYFNEEKDVLISRKFNNIDILIDDYIRQCLTVSRIARLCYWVAGNNNTATDLPDNIVRCANTKEVLEHVKAEIDNSGRRRQSR